jgi:hypothetical protein
MPSWFRRLFHKRRAIEHRQSKEETRLDDGYSSLYGLMGFRDSIEIAKKKSSADFNDFPMKQAFYVQNLTESVDKRHRPSEASTIAGQEVSLQPISAACTEGKTRLRENTMEGERQYRNNRNIGKEISGNFKKMIKEVDDICKGLDNLVNN